MINNTMKRMFNPREPLLADKPFVRLLIPLIVGLVIGGWIIPSAISFILISSLIFVSVPIALWFSKKHIKYQPLYQGTLLVGLVLTGWLLTVNYNSEPTILQSNKSDVYVFKVLDEPYERQKNYRVYLELCADSVQSYQHQNIRAIAWIDKNVSIAAALPGDFLIARTKLQPIAAPSIPGSFDSKTYYKTKGIDYQCYFKTENFRVQPDNRFNVRRLAVKCKQFFMHQLAFEGLSHQTQALMAALTLGDKTDLDESIYRTFSTTGTLHVLAVSGLHTAILYAVICFLLQWVPQNPAINALKQLGILLLLWFYTFLTGLSPSVVRAALMLSFICMGALLEKKGNAMNSLAAAAFFILCFDPFKLYDIGFQLSFLAVAGIILLQKPLFDLAYFRNRLMRYLWELLSVSLAAQLATTAVSLYYFHQFPTYFFIANLFVVPASGVLLIGTLGWFAFSWVSLLAKPLSWLLDIGYRLFVDIVSRIEQLPRAIAFEYAPTSLQTFLLYVLLASLCGAWLHKNRQLLLVSLASVCSLLLCEITLTYRSMDDTQLIISQRNNSLTFAIANDSKVALHSPENDNSEWIKAFTLKQRMQLSQNKIDTLCLQPHLTVALFDTLSVVILSGHIQIQKTPKMACSALVIKKSSWPDIENAYHAFSPQVVIVDRFFTQMRWERIRNKLPEWKNCTFLLSEQNTRCIDLGTQLNIGK